MRKIFSISMIKNEADIIESFVRYHVNIFDGMVILDNGSTDHTIPILENLIAEGLPIYLFYDTSVDYTQSEKTTKLLYITFLTFEPDLIFPLDADEFVIPANDGDHPRNVLQSLDANKLYYCELREHVPQESDPAEELFVPKRIQYSKGDDGWYKVIVSKELTCNHLPAIAMGNHDLIVNRSEGPIAKEVSGELRLAHFAIRSLEQAKSKIVVGWLNSLTRYNRKKGEGFHWESWYHQFKQHHTIVFEEFVADYYGRVPLQLYPFDTSFCGPGSLELKYTKADEVHFMRNLLEFCEALAVEYANLKSGK